MSVRLVSYNIRKALGLDMKRAPGRILDIVNRLDGDIVLLQEADRRFGNRPAALPHDLVEKGSDYTVVPLATNDVSLGWHGNAVLVRKGLGVLGTGRIELPGLEPRGAVLATVETGDGPLTVVGAHLGLLRSYRRRQVRAILSSLGEDPRDGAIIAGDFNEWSETEGLGTLARSHDLITPGKTFHARRPMAALDRIALAPGYELRDTGVAETNATRIASDHLPIWADIATKAP
ncbi:MAG: endonuclease/exonuclease/phosphatase family protein [Pseudomonadota bacterium]